MVGEVRDEDESDEGEGEEAQVDATLRASGLEEEREERERRGGLRPRDVDAYWLQRSLSKFYNDPIVAQQQAKEVLQILNVIATSLFLPILFPLLFRSITINISISDCFG